MKTELNAHLMTLDQMLKVEGNAREAALQGERAQKSETGAVSDCGFAGIARSPVKSVPGAHGPNVQWKFFRIPSQVVCKNCGLQIVPGQIHIPTSQDNTCIVKAESKTRTETAIEYRKQDAVLLEYLLQVGERMKHGEAGHAAVRVGEDVYTVRVVSHNFETITVIERQPFNPAIRNL